MRQECKQCVAVVMAKKYVARLKICRDYYNKKRRKTDRQSEKKVENKINQGCDIVAVILKNR